MNGPKLWPLDLELRRHIPFIWVSVTKPKTMCLSDLGEDSALLLCVSARGLDQLGGGRPLC